MKKFLLALGFIVAIFGQNNSFAQECSQNVTSSSYWKAFHFDVENLRVRISFKKSSSPATYGVPYESFFATCLNVDIFGQHKNQRIGLKIQNLAHETKTKNTFIPIFKQAKEGHLYTVQVQSDSSGPLLLKGYRPTTQVISISIDGREYKFQTELYNQ